MDLPILFTKLLAKARLMKLIRRFWWHHHHAILLKHKKHWLLELLWWSNLVNSSVKNKVSGIYWKLHWIFTENFIKFLKHLKI